MSGQEQRSAQFPSAWAAYPPVNRHWLFKLETYKNTARQWAEMPGENRPVVERAWMKGLADLLVEARVIIDRLELERGARDA